MMKPIHLLLVDDEERFLATTKIILDKRGMKTAIAKSGPEALELLDREPIDVAVVDVKMPGMDGIELLRKIKQRWPRIEVILLTGHASVESAVAGMKMGAGDYVMKPCDLKELAAKIEAAAEKRKKQEARSKN